MLFYNINNMSHGCYCLRENRPEQNGAQTGWLCRNSQTWKMSQSGISVILSTIEDSQVTPSGVWDNSNCNWIWCILVVKSGIFLKWFSCYLLEILSKLVDNVMTLNLNSEKFTSLTMWLQFHSGSRPTSDMSLICRCFVFGFWKCLRCPEMSHRRWITLTESIR